jgi:hypothetical protein
VTPARGQYIRVQVYGKVRFLGTFTLRNRIERLSNVIERASGFTGQGDASAAYFSWLTTKPSWENSLQRRDARRRTNPLGRAVLDTGAASDSLALENGGRRIWERVDVAEVLRRRGTRRNLFLQDGDSLYVPAKQHTMTVRSKVNSPKAMAASG